MDILKDQFGVKLSFDLLEKRIGKLDLFFSEVKDVVGAALSVRERNFRILQENQLKSVREKNTRLEEQKLQILEEINSLEVYSEKLTQEKATLKQSIQEYQNELKTIEGIVETLKTKVDEMNYGAENLQRTKRAFCIAIGWYHIFLKMKISQDASQPHRFIITFGTFDLKFQPSDHRIVLWKQNDGYCIEGNSCPLSGKELKGVLTRAWEDFQASSLSHQGSELSSTQGFSGDNSRF